MFSFEQESMLVEDREDLIALIKMRFEIAPSQVIEKIYNISEIDTLERLLITAANAPTLDIFLEELDEGDGAFKITGERFNPLSSQTRGDTDGS